MAANQDLGAFSGVSRHVFYSNPVCRHVFYNNLVYRHLSCATRATMAFKRTNHSVAQAAKALRRPNHSGTKATKSFRHSIPPLCRRHAQSNVQCPSRPWPVIVASDCGQWFRKAFPTRFPTPARRRRSVPRTARTGSCSTRRTASSASPACQPSHHCEGVAP